ncbi:MAG: methyltransferase domain-containing protein [Nitrospirae bacterium]|nr:methyltransferase domain-containing protein [Nitrospirota bacterium]
MDTHLINRYRSTHGAEAYADKYNQTWMRRLSNWREHQIVARALAACGRGGRVLNMPSGAGRFGELLKSQGFSVVGCDISLPMLEETGARWPWPLVEGSAFALPFKDRTFDGLFIMRLMHHINDSNERLTLFREAARLTRNWVLITYADYHTPKNLIRETRARWIKDRKPKITLTREQLEREVRSCGLRLERIYTVSPLFTPLALALLRKA